MRDDDGTTIARDLVDRRLDEEAKIFRLHTVALALRKRGRQGQPDRKRRGADKVARRRELVDQPAQQPLTLLHRSDELGIHLRESRSALDHLLVDVAEAQALGDEIADLLAQRSVRPGDAHYLRAHSVAGV